ncbi:MAG: site-2 protease family protein [Thermomicrobiales bacterium]
MRHDPRVLGFIDRNNPNSGFIIILALLLLTNISRGLPDRSPELIVAFLASFVIATAIHEFCHAWFAQLLGDRTAYNLGRVTLNPLVHFEPFGFIGMVMISLGFSMIGWGKPVPVNPNAFDSPRLRGPRGMAIVAIAGPISNLIQAAVVAIPLRLSGSEFSLSGTNLESFGWVFVWVNILLAAFNMIPIPPLDGSKVLLGLVPRFWYPILAPVERYGFLILMVLFFIGGDIGSSITSAMIDPPRDLFSRWIIGF